MDKNTITGFILIAAVLIGFSWWNKPSEEQMAQMRQQDSLQEVARKKAEETKKAAQLAATEKKAQKLAQAQQDTAALFQHRKDGIPLSRESVGYGPRRCLLCDNDARFCMRNHSHTQEEVLNHIKQLVRECTTNTK